MVSTKHFINDPEKLVASAIAAIPNVNPSLAVDVTNKIIYRKIEELEKVSIISGGGAGHEPSFSSFVGKGILNAAVSGSIFASPSPSQIYNALTSKVGSEKGILQIIMNYTGDVLNFGLGSEKANAAGKLVKTIVVGDDVGVGRRKSGKVGRRGIAGTVLVHKIVGAAADAGFNLKECADLAQLVADNLVTVGCSLSHVHVPGRAPAEDALWDDQIEVGMGIHNEQGSERTETPELPELVEKLLSQLLDSKDDDRAYLGDIHPDDEWVLLLNNLGGVSTLEMGAILYQVVTLLGRKHSIQPKRVYSGTYMTSLNGLGFSITLLRVKNISSNTHTSMIDLLDYPHETVGWAGPQAGFWEAEETSNDFSNQEAETAEIEPSGLSFDQNLFKSAVSAGLHSVITAEPTITKYDEIVGDGDCGVTFKKGAEAVLNLLQSNTLSPDPVITMTHIANTIEAAMDGTSGALVSIFLNALAKGLRDAPLSENKVAGKAAWTEAASAALEVLKGYTPARPGDRTLMDALWPFVETLKEGGDLKKAAGEARKGAEETAKMQAKLGRSVYVRDVGKTPDPGAVGLAEFFEGLAGVV